MEPLARTAFLALPTGRTEAWSALPDAPVVPHEARVSIIGRVGATFARAGRPVTEYLAGLRKGSGARSWDESPCRPSPTVSA
jgi:hypothetical protein